MCVMRYDQKPVHRRLIVPWYDTETACYAVLISMFIVFLFSLTGIGVAAAYEEFRGHMWVPILLLVLSALVLISTLVRLIRRYRHSLSNEFS